MKKTDDAKESEERPTTRQCKLCDGADIPLSEWAFHLWWGHGLTPAMYDDHEPGQPHPKTIEAAKIKRIPPPPPPPPPPPEPLVEIRLVDCESNPASTSVEARRGCVYHFVKGEWQEIPAPDARILLPSELSPGRYAHLQFEKREPEKRQGKTRK